MGWNSKSKIRKKAIKEGFRSGFESKIAEQLREHKIDPKEIYEKKSYKYTIPEKVKSYTPDFFLPSGIIVEAKGRLTIEDRQKMVLVKKSNPNLDIRILFQDSNSKIRKGSKTTYGEWADKNGFLWANKEIPKNWL